ncbi:DsbA family protein [Acuticoccus sp. M5D2P5]|uniref:DsbA family protein n=1 Tax=Acuticoccus kalidii TaxID=2910977 RepID=UPI001F36A889|nr:DsbA family protein [Acuticoccus kalidii]MCF3934439.1 DsbA family protein [Acuticoccus kalidii]
MTRVLATLFVALVAAGSVPASAEETTPLTRGDVETIVREYLLENPEILEEAYGVLQTKRQAEAAKERTASLETHREALESSPHSPVLGNPDGDVTLVEFFDYNCGYCRRAMEDLDRLIESDPNLRVVLKEFPVLGQPSMEAAAVSIAVQKLAPASYAEFHDRLLGRDGRADQAVALEIVSDLGLPRAEIEAELRSDSVRAAVEESYEIAQALGLSGTPSYVIGDAVEFGAVGYDALKARVNEARCGQATC